MVVEVYVVFHRDHFFLWRVKKINSRRRIQRLWQTEEKVFGESEGNISCSE